MNISAIEQIREGSENFSYGEWQWFFILAFPTLLTAGAITKAKEGKE